MSQTVYTTFHSSEPRHHVPTVCRAEGVGQAGECSSSSVCERGGHVRPWCCIGWRLAALSSALLELSSPCEHLSPTPASSLSLLPCTGGVAKVGKSRPGDTTVVRLCLPQGCRSKDAAKIKAAGDRVCQGLLSHLLVIGHCGRGKGLLVAPYIRGH